MAESRSQPLPPPAQPPLPCLPNVPHTPSLAPGTVLFKPALARFGIVARPDLDHDALLCVSPDGKTFHVRPNLPHSYVLLLNPDGSPVRQALSSHPASSSFVTPTSAPTSAPTRAPSHDDPSSSSSPPPPPPRASRSSSRSGSSPRIGPPDLPFPLNAFPPTAAGGGSATPPSSMPDQRLLTPQTFQTHQTSQTAQTSQTPQNAQTAQTAETSQTSQTPPVSTPIPLSVSDDLYASLLSARHAYFSKEDELAGMTDWLNHVWTVEEDKTDELRPEMIALVLQLGAGSGGYGAVSRLLATQAALPSPPLAHIAALNVDPLMLQLLQQYGGAKDEAYEGLAFDGCTPLQVLAGLCEHKLLGPVFEAERVAAATIGASAAAGGGDHARHDPGVGVGGTGPAEFLKCAVGLHRREELGWVLGAPGAAEEATVAAAAGEPGRLALPPPTPSTPQRGGGGAGGMGNVQGNGPATPSSRAGASTPSPPPDATLATLMASWPFYPATVDLEPGVIRPPRDAVFFPSANPGAWSNSTHPPSPGSAHYGSSPTPSVHLPLPPSPGRLRFYPPTSPRLQPTVHTPAQSHMAHTLLHERRALLMECAKLLIGHGANPAHINGLGVPVLHSAMASKNDDLAMLIIDCARAKGVEWDWYELPESVGNPLHGVASWGAYLAIVSEVVVERVRTMDKEARTRCLEMVDRDGFAPLHRAAMSGNYQLVKIIVSEFGGDANIATASDCATPLILAATFGHPRTVSTLLELGADVDVADERGWTATDVAQGLEYRECLALLIEAGGEAEVAAVEGVFHCGNVAGGCTKVEEAKGEFAPCRRCDARRYCSDECGREDFYIGAHKYMCRNAKGTSRRRTSAHHAASDALASTSAPVAIPIPGVLAVGSGGSGPVLFDDGGWRGKQGLPNPIIAPYDSAMSLSGWIKSFSSSSGGDHRRNPSTVSGSQPSSSWFQSDSPPNIVGGNRNVRILLRSVLEGKTEKDQSAAFAELLPLYADAFADASQKEVENSAGTFEDLRMFAALAGNRLNTSIMDLLEVFNKREASLSLLERFRSPAHLQHLLRVIEILSKATEITGDVFARSKLPSAVLRSYLLLATGLPLDLRNSHTVRLGLTGTSGLQTRPDTLVSHSVASNGPHSRFQAASLQRTPSQRSPPLLTSPAKPHLSPQSPQSLISSPSNSASPMDSIRSPADRQSDVRRLQPLVEASEMTLGPRGALPPLNTASVSDDGAADDVDSSLASQQGGPTSVDVISTQRILQNILTQLCRSGDAAKDMINQSAGTEGRAAHGSTVLALFQLIESARSPNDWSHSFKLGAMSIVQAIVKSPIPEPRLSLWTAFHSTSAMKILVHSIRAYSLSEDHRKEIPHDPQNLIPSQNRTVEKQANDRVGHAIGSELDVQSQDVCSLVELIVEILRESTKSRSTVPEDFRNSKGYEEMETLVRAMPTDVKIKLVDLLHELLVVGPEEMVPTFSLSPYQHVDFRLPVGASSSATFRNSAMLNLFTGIFLYPYMHQERLQTGQVVGKSTKTTVPSESARNYIGVLLFDLIKANPLNYFLAEKSGMWLQFAEKMEDFDEVSQRQFLQIIVYSMKELNYVPFRELACLCTHFQGLSQTAVAILIVETFLGLMAHSHRIKDVLREVGFLNVLCGIVQTTVAALETTEVETCAQDGLTEGGANDAQSDSNVMPEVSLVHESKRSAHFFTTEVTDRFDVMMKCVMKLVEDNEENATLFRKASKGASALAVIRQLIVTCASYPSGNRGAVVNNKIGDKDLDSMSVTNFEFGRLIELLHSARKTKLEDDSERRKSMDLLSMKLDILKTLREVLKLAPMLRDSLRDAGGFVCCISVLASLEGMFSGTEESESGDYKVIQLEVCREILRSTFVLLTESIREYDPNRTYFADQVGYSSLEESIRLTGVLTTPSAWLIAASFLALTLEEVEILDVWFPGQSAEHLVVTSAANQIGPQSERYEGSQPNSVLGPKHYLEMHPEVLVRNPKVTLHLLRLLPDMSDLATGVPLGVLETLKEMITKNQWNLIKLNSVPILNLLLDWYCADSGFLRVNGALRSVVATIMKSLLSLGISDSALRSMFEKVKPERVGDNVRAADVYELILHGLQFGRTPHHVHFDTLAGEIPCLVLNNLGEVSFFPVNGWSFCGWFRFEKMADGEAVSLLKVVESDTGLGVLRIDMEGSLQRLSVMLGKSVTRFDGFTFQMGLWYHLGIVHSRSRVALGSSTITLYVDGTMAEQMKCSYPSATLQGHKLKCVIGSDSFSAGARPQQVWDAGVVYFVQDVVDADSVNIMFCLGPQYHGNFQDNLRKYQTYEILDGVNLDNVNKFDDSTYDIGHLALAGAVVRVAGQPIVEDHLIFVISATNAGDVRVFAPWKPGASQSQNSIIALVIPDSAKPKHSVPPQTHRVTELSSISNSAIVQGGALVVRPDRLVDGVWKLGGCSLLLRFVEDAKSSEMMHIAIQVLVEAVRFNWRNTEDVERNHLYETLGLILKRKMPLITSTMLDTLLLLVGRIPSMPTECILGNTLAYRFLFLDFEMWRGAGLDVQQKLLDQFKYFVIDSRKRLFNVRRLSKLYLVKRLLMALRTDVFSPILLPQVVEVLRIMLQASFSPEAIRSIATFLMASLPRDITTSTDFPNTNALSKRESRQSRSVSAGQRKGDSFGTPELVRDAKEELLSVLSAGTAPFVIQTRITLLEMLTNIICEPGNVDFATSFAQTITARWLLLFMDERLDNWTVVLATRMMAKIIGTQGPKFIERFRNTTQGFTIMAHLLDKHWNLVQVHHSLFAITFGVDVSDIPVSSSNDLYTLLTFYRPDPRKSRSFCLDGLLCMTSILRTAVEVVHWDYNQATNITAHSEVSSTDKSIRPKDIQSLRDIATMIQVYFHALGELFTLSDDVKELFSKQEAIDAFVVILFQVICENQIQLTAELELKLSEGQNPVESFANFEQLNREDYRLTLPSSSAAIDSQRSELIVTTPLNPVAVELDGLRSSSLESILEFIVAMAVESIVGDWKPLMLLESILRATPPASVEDRTRFRIYLLSHIIQELRNVLQLRQKVLLDPQKISIMARFVNLLVDQLYIGWLADSADAVQELVVFIVESVLLNDPRNSKPELQELYPALNRVILFRFHKDMDKSESDLLALIERLLYHQKVVLSNENNDSEFFACLLHHLWRLLLLSNADTLKPALLNKPQDMAALLKSKSKGFDYRELIEGFSKILEMDTNSFLRWIQTNGDKLSTVFQEGATRVWESHLAWEQKSSKEYVKALGAKREARLKRLEKLETSNSTLLGKYAGRTQNWIADVQDNEILRYKRFAQDYADTSLFIEEDWSKLVEETSRERAVWGVPLNPFSHWKLDFTEGPYRQRKKLRLNLDKSDPVNKQVVESAPKPPPLTSTGAKHKESEQRVRQVHVDAEYFGEEGVTNHYSETVLEKSYLGLNAVIESSRVPNVVPEVHEAVAENARTQVKDPEESSAQEHDDNDQSGETSVSTMTDDDKNRKVARLLDPGDTVIESYNSARVLGLDICEGLLVICKHNIYLIDNYIRRSDGELDEVSHVLPEERNIYNVILKGKNFGSADLKHEARKWAYESIKEVHKRKFLFRNVGLEIFLVDGRNFLITLDPKDRETVYSRLLSKASAAAANANENLVNEDQTMGLKLQSIFFGASSLVELVSRWERRELSNFEYLMRLNTLAGRTYNDLTQYPVFPWVLRDYMSKEGGHFDHADRLFHSISYAWESASRLNTTDVRELIPEFYYLPEFLINMNQHNFGIRQTGESIGDVVLPPWAKGDSRLFVSRMREALESDHVSEHLNEWIDLVFGYKQQGDEAAKSQNVFHYLSYEGAVDIDAIADPIEKQATIGIINNFGQTPRQLFRKPHPKRQLADPTEAFYRIQAHPELLLQSMYPIQDIQQPIAAIQLNSEKITVLGASRALLPPQYTKFVEWGFTDGSLRLCNINDDRVLGIFESMHLGTITCAQFADEETLVTGGSDTVGLLSLSH
ncbi:hypothetical protein HDU93_002592 [Gonapodya sp. JEL0774]|nr:hypothetical protein HDU93_002592 [Gonapodya sp. JEL0774]